MDVDAVRARTPAVRAAIIVGTAMEWYDFYLYAALSALVFGQVFFSTVDPTTGTLASLGTFAAGFVARPFGGLLFGAMGDRIGRKNVLLVVFVVMGVATGLIGLLPGYAQIGVAAPVLLVVLRVVQGLGAGAELGSAMTVAFEYAGTHNRGRLGALPALGVAIGVFLSSLTVLLLTSVDEDFLLSWGWRIPFVFAFALVAIGFWVRRQMPETPQFQAYREQHRQRTPVRDLVRGDWRGLLVVIGLALGFNCISYILNTFSLSYLKQFTTAAANTGATGAFIGAVVALVVIPLAGRLSDAWSPRAVLITGSIVTILFAFPFFWLLSPGSSWPVWLALGFTTGVVTPAMLAAQGSFLAAQFPTGVRATGLGAGREIGSAFAGGFSPLIAFGLVAASPTHSTVGVSFMFIVGALLVIAASLFDRSEDDATPDIGHTRSNDGAAATRFARTASGNRARHR